MTEGNASAAAPVFDKSGRVVAAISVVVPAANPNLSALAQGVRVAAAVITRTLRRDRRGMLHQSSRRGSAATSTSTTSGLVRSASDGMISSSATSSSSALTTRVIGQFSPAARVLIETSSNDGQGAGRVLRGRQGDP